MKNILIILITIVFISCNKRKESGISQYTINIDEVKVEDNILMSSISKNVNTIILNCNNKKRLTPQIKINNSLDAKACSEEVLIGRIDALQVVGDFLFVLDKRYAKKLFHFNKEGEFIKTIGSLGIGPHDYLSISDFCIDEKNKEVYLLDDMGAKIIKYNYESGEYISSIKLDYQSSYNYILYHNNNLYTNFCYVDQEQNDNMLLKINPPTEKRTEYLSAAKYNLGWNQSYYNGNNFFSSKLSPIPKYKQLLTNTVMAIGKDSIYQYLTLETKHWAKKEDILTDEQLRELDEDQFIILDNKRRSHQIRNYIEWKEWIFLQIFSDGDEKVVLFNTENKKVRCGKRLLNDITCSKGNIYPSFQYSDSKAIYEVVDVSILSEELKQGRIILSPNLDKREELMSLTEDDERFVIFEYTFE